ncbi:MAG: MBL fold metallo-hydrolase [Terracidiphilus sp.]|jgi:glyoxylase-like metal-dependent hydrolase (beta-lactamase superfamily II)
MNKLLMVTLLALLVPLGSAAQDPKGFRQFHVGAVEVTALQDGWLNLDTKLLKGIDEAGIKELLGSTAPVTTSVNAFVVRTGKHTILIDAGSKGNAMGGSMGHLLDKMQQAGIDPASIEAVLITHMHFDHVSNLLTADGKRAFPNATVRMAKAEYDYWLDPALPADSERKQSQQMLKTVLAPYEAAGACKPFAPGEEPFPGVTALTQAGHTPGHTVYKIGKGKDAVWFIGDLIHFGGVQFARPQVTVAFDTDSAKAMANRIETFNAAEKQGAVIAAAHIAFPGMGRLVAKGSGYEWVPLK